jgi:hypothetical protein
VVETDGTGLRSGSVRADREEPEIVVVRGAAGAAAAQE